MTLSLRSQRKKPVPDEVQFIDEGKPRLQMVTNHEGSSADVDLDMEVFHKSSPKDVFKAFVKRFSVAQESCGARCLVAMRRAAARVCERCRTSG